CRSVESIDEDVAFDDVCIFPDPHENCTFVAKIDFVVSSFVGSMIGLDLQEKL
ncbi:unnamed protein product, partial [Citrullus colocynthis]